MGQAAILGDGAGEIGGSTGGGGRGANGSTGGGSWRGGGQPVIILDPGLMTMMLQPYGRGYHLITWEGRIVIA